MSNKTPTILKKEDSQRPSRTQVHQPIKPKILTKSNKKENLTITTTKKVNNEPSQCLPMKTSMRLMSPHFQIDQKILEFLDTDNTDFLVVGVCGLKNIGKSTILNLIANQDYLCDDKGIVSFKPDGIFSTNGVTLMEGSTIDMFISSDRIIFLDTSPLISNHKRDMIVSECDDIKTMIVMLQMCHLLLVVHGGHPEISVERILIVADQMVPNNLKHRPTFVHIGNKVQPGTKLLEMDARISRFSLLIPNLHHPSVHLHHDLDQLIQELQEKVYMVKRWSMAETEDEPFTEKKWGQRLLAVVENMKNDYFLRKYEGFRDKFHQPIEA